MLVVPARPGDLDGEEEHTQVVSARLGLGVKGAHGPFQIVVTGREPLGYKARPPRQEELNRTRLSRAAEQAATPRPPQATRRELR